MERAIAKIVAASGMLIAALAFAPSSYATVTLDVQNGILMGATDIDVNGTLYDVSFEDGSCDSLFNNCDPTTFTFQSSTDAQAASQALLDSVFINGPAGDFQSYPGLTNGCETLDGPCSTYTPYGPGFSRIPGYINAVYAYNGPPQSLFPTVGYTMIGRQFDTTGSYTDATYAIWSAHTDVPEPTSLALFGIGLVGLGLSQRKRKVRVKTVL